MIAAAPMTVHSTPPLPSQVTALTTARSVAWPAIRPLIRVAAARSADSGGAHCRRTKMSRSANTTAAAVTTTSGARRWRDGRGRLASTPHCPSREGSHLPGSQLVTRPDPFHPDRPGQGSSDLRQQRGRPVPALLEQPMTGPQTPRHVEVKDGDQTVAAAEVTTAKVPEEPPGPRCTRHPNTSVPVTGRTWSMPSWTPRGPGEHPPGGQRPLGDGELLERLRERTEDAVTRPAGSRPCWTPTFRRAASRKASAASRKASAASRKACVWTGPIRAWPHRAAAAASPWRCRRAAEARRKEGTVAIATINPATGQTVKTYDEMSEADVERCLAAAAAAHQSYRLTSFDERAGWMNRAAAICWSLYKRPRSRP